MVTACPSVTIIVDSFKNELHSGNLLCYDKITSPGKSNHAVYIKSVNPISVRWMRF